MKDCISPTSHAQYRDESGACLKCDLEEANLQVEVYRAAYRARFAVQNHENGCPRCNGIYCEAGNKLRLAASAAEEKAGEMDRDVIEHRAGKCSCGAVHPPESLKRLCRSCDHEDTNLGECQPQSRNAGEFDFGQLHCKECCGNKAAWKLAE
jgi:hypothetical protein